jgi:hypothetical protein
MSNGANHNTRNRTVILSEVDGSRRNTADPAAGLKAWPRGLRALRCSLDFARNDLNV